MVVVAPVREVDVLIDGVQQLTMEGIKEVFRILLLCLCSVTAYGIYFLTHTVNSCWHFVQKQAAVSY